MYIQMMMNSQAHNSPGHIAMNILLIHIQNCCMDNLCACGFVHHMRWYWSMRWWFDSCMVCIQHTCYFGIRYRPHNRSPHSNHTHILFLALLRRLYMCMWGRHSSSMRLFDHPNCLPYDMNLHHSLLAWRKTPVSPSMAAGCKGIEKTVFSCPESFP